MGLFDVRDEFHFVLADRFDDADTPRVLNDLLALIGEAPRDLAPIVEIANARYGFDLNQYERGAPPRKIGFVVVDAFAGRILENDRAVPARGQIEIEILPDQCSFVSEHAREVSDVARSIEDLVGAVGTRVPKYRQILGE